MKRAICLLPLLRGLAVALVFVALVGPSWAGDEPGGQGAPGGPSSLKDMEAELTKITARLEELVAKAGRDARFRMLEAYKDYSPEDFEDRNRSVKAIDLLDIVADADAPMKLREAALALLTTKDRIRHDPNLQISKGQHGKPRNDFCRKNVTKLLSDKNPYTRKFAHELLKAYFRTHKDDPLVLEYDWKEGSRTQWRKVANYWNKVLKR